MVSPIPMMLLFGSWAYPALRPPRRFGQHEVSSHKVSFFSFLLSPTFVTFLSHGCVFVDAVPFFYFCAWLRSTCPMYLSFVFFVRGAGGSFFVRFPFHVSRFHGSIAWHVRLVPACACIFFSASRLLGMDVVPFPLVWLVWVCGAWLSAAVWAAYLSVARVFPWVPRLMRRPPTCVVVLTCVANCAMASAGWCSGVLVHRPRRSTEDPTHQ